MTDMTSTISAVVEDILGVIYVNIFILGKHGKGYQSLLMS